MKNHALTNLDHYLLEAEAQLQANGAEVHWASDAAEAREIVIGLAERHSVKSVVKGKSMATEEIDLNPALEEAGIEVFETDLGEYVLQLLEEPPSHILGPAIHKSLQQVQDLFADRLGSAPDGDPDTLARAARRVLRDAFINSGMGITGGNFLVAETGTVALIENEGNIRLTTSLPRVHVAVVGIEKLLPKMTDLAGFLQLTTRAATGQPIGCFVSLIQGPAVHPDDDGPEEVHVVLVDNGRTDVLAHEQRLGGAALRPLRRVPERMPRVPPDGRPRLRMGLLGADRVGAGPRIAGTPRGDAAPVRVFALRRLHRRLPGADPDPGTAARMAAGGTGSGAHSLEGTRGAGGFGERGDAAGALPAGGEDRFPARRDRGRAGPADAGRVGARPGAAETEQADVPGAVAGGDRMRAGGRHGY